MRGGTVGSVRQEPADLTTTTRATRWSRREKERRRMVQIYWSSVRLSSGLTVMFTVC